MKTSIRKNIVRRRYYLIPIVMLVVASIHMWQWNTIARSSWGAGAGFGMFATVDYHGSRFFRCYLVDGGREVPVEMPVRLNIAGVVARAMPTADNMERIANQLAESLVNDQVFAVASAEPTVRVELWGMNIEARNRRLTSKKIREASVSVMNPEWGFDHVAAIR